MDGHCCLGGEAVSGRVWVCEEGGGRLRGRWLLGFDIFRVRVNWFRVWVGLGGLGRGIWVGKLGVWASVG